MKPFSVFAAVAGIFLFASGSLFAQAPKIEFEVASIRPAQQGAPMGPRMMQGRLGLRVEGDRANIYFLSVADMIRLAYHAKSYQLLEVNFLQADRWDVQAKLPEGASREQVPEMVRTMLEDRFKLKVHMETKEQNGYALVTAKDGPKIQPSGSGGFVGEGAANALSTQFGSAGPMRLTPPSAANPKGQMELAAVSMDSLADLLSPMVNKPVVDMTGLKGPYRISLQMEDMDWGAALLIGSAGIGINIAGLPGDVPDDLGSTISQTLSRLGLRLESRKVPVQMIVIDHVEKTPTEN